MHITSHTELLVPTCLHFSSALFKLFCSTTVVLQYYNHVVRCFSCILHYHNCCALALHSSCFGGGSLWFPGSRVAMTHCVIWALHYEHLTRSTLEHLTYLLLAHTLSPCTISCLNHVMAALQPGVLWCGITQVCNDPSKDTRCKLHQLGNCKDELTSHTAIAV